MFSFLSLLESVVKCDNRCQVIQQKVVSLVKKGPCIRKDYKDGDSGCSLLYIYIYAMVKRNISNLLDSLKAQHGVKVIKCG